MSEPALIEPAVNEPAVNDIVELQERVETAGDHFNRMAEQHRTEDMRLARLLEGVEKRFSRSRLEIDRLGSELTRSREENQQLRGLLGSELTQLREENQQLRGLLQSLAATADDCGQLGGDEAMSGLEQRISSPLSEAAAEPHNSPAEGGADDKAGEGEDPASGEGLVTYEAMWQRLRGRYSTDCQDSQAAPPDAASSDDPEFTASVPDDEGHAGARDRMDEDPAPPDASEAVGK